MEFGVYGEFIAVKYKIGDESSCIRHLFVKSHEGKDDAKPSNRTLFILNVPQYLNEKCLKFLYRHCGTIKHIFIHSKPKGAENEISCSFSTKEPTEGYKVAYIVFEESTGLVSALSCQELPSIPIKMFNTSVGLKKWIGEYNKTFMDITSIQQEIETYMTDYDHKLEKEKEKSKDMDVDEDGWITISKYSRQQKISRNEEVNKIIKEKEKKKIAKKMLLNFYRCQLQDAKMENILELRKKFDKDKERIALMKANRKFKPF